MRIYVFVRPEEILIEERGCWLMLVTICDDTRTVFSMRHITPNSKRWDYSTIPDSGTFKRYLRFDLVEIIESFELTF